MWCERWPIKLFLFIIIIFHSSENKIKKKKKRNNNNWSTIIIVNVLGLNYLCKFCTERVHERDANSTKALSCFSMKCEPTHKGLPLITICALCVCVYVRDRAGASLREMPNVYRAPNQPDVSNTKRAIARWSNRKLNKTKPKWIEYSTLEHQLHSIISFSRIFIDLLRSKSLFIMCSNYSVSFTLNRKVFAVFELQFVRFQWFYFSSARASVPSKISDASCWLENVRFAFLFM